jgi:hypothetical protein
MLLNISTFLLNLIYLVDCVNYIDAIETGNRCLFVFGIFWRCSARPTENSVGRWLMLVINWLVLASLPFLLLVSGFSLFVTNFESEQWI